MTDSTLQWKRECKVIMGANTVIGGVTVGAGRSVEDLRVQFEITKTLTRTLNVAEVKIFNMSQDHEAQVGAEFDEILVNAGYQDASLLIFRGNIKHWHAYREGNDRILKIEAADGDRDIRLGFINVTLAKGTNTSHLIDKITGGFSTTKKGSIVIKERTRIRGRTLSGASEKFLDDMAKESDANWSITDGLLDIVRVDSTLPTEAVVLRSDTGMLGAPELSDKGIKVTCLLNPRIKPNGTVWLNNNDLKDKIAKAHERKPGARSAKAHKAHGQLARLDPQGLYKVFKVVHKGDTRGKDWQSEIYCKALPGIAPETGLQVPSP